MMRLKQNASTTDQATKDDLMFSTEVDTAGMDFSRNNVNSMGELKGKESQMTYNENVASTQMTDIGNSSAPRNFDDLDQREMIEFKDVIKQLINKEHCNVVQLEEKILAKMKKKALSRGWERQTGVKVAPLKILAQLTTR